MRIHHVAPHFFPDRGGVESYVLRLSEYLVRRGHTVVVHTSDRATDGTRLPGEDRVGEITVRRYPPWLHLGYYLTSFHPDLASAEIVHLHGYGLLANDWCARRARSLGTPVVYTLDHGVSRPEPTAAARVKRAVYDALVGRRTLARVSAIISLNEADRRWLESRGIPHDRVHVIPSGLEEEAFSAGSPSRARGALGVERYILYLGRLHREKSVDILLRAYALLSRTDVSLVIAGPDAGERDRLEALASSLHVADRVRFAGDVDESSKRDILAGCEVLVLPSFYEAQGIAILEAWAQGRPVIATRVGGVPDLATDGEDALLVPWGDAEAMAAALRRILADPRYAAALGAAGFARARQTYRWDALGPRIEAIYEAVRRA